MGLSNFHLFPSETTPSPMESKFFPKPTSQFQEKTEDFGILVSSLKIKLPSLPEFKLVQEDEDGCTTPKSLNDRLPLICPPAPRKPKSIPLTIRKRRNLIDLSREINALFPPVLFADLNGKIKKVKKTHEIKVCD